MKPLKLEMTAFGSYAETAIVAFDRFESGLFLVTGDTGAGKTTIFDAIMYALYGAASGSERKGDMLHCDLVPKSADTVVRLIFEQSGKEYTVKRTIHFSRKRGKTDEYNEGKPDAVLIEPGQKTVSGSSKVTDRITEIIGLNREQFRQIVMLAQGEFKQFLKSDSEKKSEILGRLFDNSAYIRYRDLLIQAKAKLKEERNESTELIRSFMTHTFIPPEEESFHDGAWLPESPQLTEDLQVLIRREKEKIAVSENMRKKCSGIHAELNAAYGAAEGKNRRLDELAEKSAHLEELHKSEDEFAKLQERADTAEAAHRQVMPAYIAEKEAGKRLIDLQKDIEGLSISLQEREKDKASSEALLKEDEPKKEKAESLTKQITSLSDSLPAYRKLKQQEKDIALRSAKITYDTEQMRETEISLEKLKEKLTAEQAESEILRNAETEKLQSETDLKNELAVLDQIRGRGGLLMRLSEISVRDRKLSEKETELKQIFEETMQCKERYDDLYMRYFDGQSGLLAQKMEKSLNEKGEAFCPVCGTHFIKGQDHHFAHIGKGVPSQAEVEKAKSAFEKKDRIREKNLKERDILTAEICKDRNETVLAADRLFADCTDWETLSDPQYLKNRTDALLSKIAELQHYAAEAQKKCERHSYLLKQIAEDNEAQASLREKLSRLSAGIEKETAELHSRQNSLNESRNDLQYENEDEVNREIRKLQSEKESLNREIRKHIADNNAAQKNYNTVKGALDSQREKLPVLVSAKERAHADLLDSLQKTGFASCEAAMEALQDMPDPDRWLKEAAREIQAYKNDLKQTENRIAELKEETAGWTRQDLNILKEQIAEAQKKLDDASAKLSSEIRLVQNHEKVLEAIRGAKEKLADTDGAWRMLEKLADIAAGSISEGGRLSFDRYVMGAALREIIGMANIRLEILSGGQYQLVHQAEGYRKNAKAGLEIEVLDRNTGIQRESASLSGGESFIVSLSLALGLSDVVMSRSGGRELDTLFIDEGFGTLDDDVLDKAVQVLNSLSDDAHHLVGIISHVSRLEESIVQKIVVKNGPKGSTLKITGTEK